VGGAAKGQRERVFEEAMHAIADVGPDRTTMRVLSARLQMSPGHILYYFGSKDRLLLETLLWSEEDKFREERPKIERARTNATKLRRIVEGYIPTSGRDPRWLLWAYMFAQPPDDKAGLAAVQEIGRPWFDALQEALRDGVDAGEFQALDDETVALRANALMDGLALSVLLGMREVGRAWAIREAMAYLDEATGLTGKGAKRVPRAFVR